VGRHPHSRWRAPQGIAGTVIDGINRDIALCLAPHGYPVFSRDSWMRTGKDRVQVEATQVPVSIGDVRVCPGDLVRGDADGVVVIPRDLEDKVLASAEEIQTAEDAIRESVRAGLSLRDARAKHHYHQLQSREASR
jgi:regulator of RNase E activity RraA